MVALKLPLAVGTALALHRTLPDPSLSTSWMVWLPRREVPLTVIGLATAAPSAGVVTWMGEPAAAVSGGVVVEVEEAAAPLVDVVDWASTPWVVEVEEVVVECESALGEAELQAARPRAAAMTRAEVERDFMAPIIPPGAMAVGAPARLGPVAGSQPPGIPDLVGPGLAVLFCGINPGWRSAERGLHFGGPGNRFWKVLHGAGFTEAVLDPAEQARLPSLGLGITNLVARPTRAAAELTRAELRAGAADLEATAATWGPRWVAVVGMDAYRRAFSRPRAGIGPQAESLASAGVWVLPNPSGLQARYGLAEMVAAYGELARAAGCAPR